MSHVRGHWTETANPTFHCGLTARPAVSEKTLRPEPPSSSHFEWRLGPRADCLTEAPKTAGHSVAYVPTPLFPELSPLMVRQAMPAVCARTRRRGEAAVSTRFRPAALARYRALSAAWTTSSTSGFSLSGFS